MNRLIEDTPAKCSGVDGKQVFTKALKFFGAIFVKIDFAYRPVSTSINILFFLHYF